MDEEKICSYCEQPIEGDEFKTLGDESIVCNECFEEACKQCAVCDEYYIEDSMKALDDDDGTLVCEDCYEYRAEECGICGGHFLEDDMTFWGDIRICPSCLDDRCPSFDEEKVEEETQEAYDAFCAKYVGKRVLDQETGEIEFDETVGDEAPTCYSISVTIDENGVITEISRLTASMLLSEGERSSDWRPYPISSSDYRFWAEDLLEDNLEFADDDNDEDDECDEDEKE